MDNLFICFNAFLLLFIFLAGGINKMLSFQGTVDFLKMKVNAIHLSPIFIIAIMAAILYFYVTMIMNGNQGKTNMYLFILIGIAFIGIPALVYFKRVLSQTKWLISLIYNTAIVGVIGLLTFGSLLILYSLYTSKYEEYAYIATIGLAVFTAMTILIFHFPSNPSEMISFTKNLSIFGGLMLLSQRFIR